MTQRSVPVDQTIEAAEDASDIWVSESPKVLSGAELEARLAAMEAATELPRLMRPLPASAMPGPTVLALYDPAKNLVIYNKDMFDLLTAADQRATLRTRRTITLDLRDFI